MSHVDDILCATKESWEDLLEGLDKVFRRLRQAGLKVNAKKSNFEAHKMECSGCNVTRAGTFSPWQKGTSHPGNQDA
jgi:hypothetical protein